MPSKGADNLHLLSDIFVRKYLQSLSSTLQQYRIQGIVHLTPPLETAVHPYRPGDWIWVKKWNPEPLGASWDGPFQVLLVTETAVHTAEKGWTHHTRTKRGYPPKTWCATPVQGSPLKLKITNSDPSVDELPSRIHPALRDRENPLPRRYPDDFRSWDCDAPEWREKERGLFEPILVRDSRIVWKQPLCPWWATEISLRGNPGPLLGSFQT